MKTAKTFSYRLLTPFWSTNSASAMFVGHAYSPCNTILKMTLSARTIMYCRRVIVLQFEISKQVKSFCLGVCHLPCVQVRLKRASICAMLGSSKRCTPVQYRSACQRNQTSKISSMNTQLRAHPWTHHHKFQCYRKMWWARNISQGLIADQRAEA